MKKRCYTDMIRLIISMEQQLTVEKQERLESKNGYAQKYR